MTWGVDTHIIERFGKVGVPKEKIATVKEPYSFISAEKSPARFIELLERYYGPTMNAFDAAQKNGKVDELHGQLLELAKAQNKGADGGTSIPATFLRVTVSL